jgi:hypothetical protein
MKVHHPLRGREKCHIWKDHNAKDMREKIRKQRHRKKIKTNIKEAGT